MPRFKKRMDYEAEIARRMGRAQREVYNELIDQLGDNPSMDKIEPGFWDKAAGILRGAVQSLFEAAILDYLGQRLKDQPVAFDWSVVNARAAEWARNYSFELVKGINDRTRAALQEKIAGFYEDKRTLAELKQSIGQLFGPVRAEMIAVTETTRAVAGGEDIFKQELEAMGLTTRQVIQTSNDELVCPVCGPKSGKTTAEEGHPPFHIRCRCWENTEVVAA